jgi:hypothetical protein
MSDVAWGATVVLLTGAVWVVGGVLQWHNLRRLEKLVARSRRSVRHALSPTKPAEISAVPEEAEESARVESLRLANRCAVR